jgi:hypothetical protein
MVQSACDNSHTIAVDINLATLRFTAQSFSSGSIEAASAAKAGNKQNTILYI